MQWSPCRPPPLPCCSFSPVGVSFSLVAISYRAQLGRLGGSRSGLGSSNKNPVPHTQYQGTLLAPNRCSMHPIAVLIPVSHREFRSNLPSLAYLSVYPFGPRFLLFTVRNAVHLIRRKLRTGNSHCAGHDASGRPKVAPIDHIHYN